MPYSPFLGVGSRFYSVGRDTISSGGKAISKTVGVTNASVFERQESQVRSVNVVAFTNGFHGVFHELRQQQPTALL